MLIILNVHNHYIKLINELSDEFNAWIGLNMRYYRQEEPPKHRILLQLFDKKYLCLLYEIADD